MPVFYILIFLAACLLCILLSALYRPLGWIAQRIWKDAKEATTEEDNNKEGK